MHYEMKPYPMSSSSHHRTTDKVVLKRESEAIHVGCVTEGMDSDRVGYNATTAQCGIQVCTYVIHDEVMNCSVSGVVFTVWVMNGFMS